MATSEIRTSARQATARKYFQQTNSPSGSAPTFETMTPGWIFNPGRSEERRLFLEAMIDHLQDEPNLMEEGFFVSSCLSNDQCWRHSWIQKHSYECQNETWLRWGIFPSSSSIVQTTRITGTPKTDRLSFRIRIGTTFWNYGAWMDRQSRT